MKFWLLCVGLISGNFLYQLIGWGPADWEAAVEHSYFQLIAFIAIRLFAYNNPNPTNTKP